MRSRRHILSLLLLSALLFGCQNQKKIESDPSSSSILDAENELSGVYYLIRHAEKDRANPKEKDPELTPVGLERAQRWQQFFDSIPLAGIYSTAYKRTLQTIIPTAAEKSLNPIIYQPLDLINDDFYKRSSLGHWLIVGHSNTIPQLTNSLMRTDTLNDIPDSLNSRLYKVDYRSNPATLSLFHIE